MLDSSRVLTIFLQVNADAQGWELIGACASWFCAEFYATGLATFAPEILESAYNGDLNLVKDYRFVRMPMFDCIRCLKFNYQNYIFISFRTLSVLYA